MNKVYKWIDSIQSMFFPPLCLLCGQRTEGPADLCPGCYDDLPWIPHACVRCGLPLPWDTPLCGTCLKRPPTQERTRVLWHYTPPVSGLIAALKFRGQLPCARLLGELMSFTLQDIPRPDCLLPILLHPKRYRERGFNQSTEIARPVSRNLNIPLRPDLCRRLRSTPPQRELDAKHRLTNLRGVFAAKKEVRGLHIALVDDVMTTGATVQEVAATLKGAGAGRIEAWILARA